MGVGSAADPEMERRRLGGDIPVLAAAWMGGVRSGKEARRRL